MWHYARGLSFIAMRQFDKSAQELSGLVQIVQNKNAQSLDQPNFPGYSLVVISRHSLAGELAGRRGRIEEMIGQYDIAIQLEDKLPYMEPPYWHHPVRQSFGATLLQAGRPAEAERVYRKDLKRHPANGWSLFGLLQSLRAQGKTEEAAMTARQFKEAWRYADVILTASRF
jgi:tetratricopeptide (TPR) repeat protein